MISIQLQGGLGNQMFQYACGRSIAFKLKTELFLDTTQLQNYITGYTSRSLELGIFNIKYFQASNRNTKIYKPLFYRIANVLAFKVGLRGIQTSKYFVEKGYNYNAAIDKVAKDCSLMGYWQSFRYFENIESLLREEFQFQRILDDDNQNRLNRINLENSISLHIRRSDYVNNKSHDIHGTCSIEYYKKAVENIASKVSNPSFFIFSDDIEWAYTKLNFNYPCVFVAGNNGAKSYIDMQLMSHCKHNIIANSSFSWWGAWLNSNPNKIVIAPKQWFAEEKMNLQTNDLIPNVWIRL